MKFDVFGTLVTVVREENRWVAYYPGPEGKKRPAQDIVIPADIAENNIGQYLADLCHEWATPAHQDVRVLS